MQNEKQATPIWVSDIWKAFGSEGIVTLAWWTGAMYAEQVRERMGCFPLLNISGLPGAGKNVLLEALSRISGDLEFISLDPERATRAGLLRYLDTRSSRVATLELDAIESRGSLFESDIKEMYSGGKLLLKRRPETVEFNFRGALAMSTSLRSLCQSLQVRSIDVCLTNTNHTDESRQAAARLMQLQDLYVEQYLERVEAFREQAPQIIDRLGRQHTAALMKHDFTSTSARNAANHGQLAAMVDLLGEMLCLPSKILKAAQQEVVTMFDCRFLPF